MDRHTRSRLFQPDAAPTISHQAELLGVSRSSYYYQPVPETALNLRLIELIDKHYLEHPDKGPDGCFPGSEECTAIRST